jgi:uncharacterized protein YciI/uncharacterized protein YndB with AHSA1/START domain
MRLLPIRRQIVVSGDPYLAYGLFLDDIGAWWPLGSHSVFGAGGSVSVRKGRLVEVGPDGQEAVWGTLLETDPPRRFRLTWHPGRGPERATEIEVRFAGVGDGQTLVTLEHSGWERLADPVPAREDYGHGWPVVLDSYVSGALARGQAPWGSEAVWFALLHSPGPALGPEEQIFTHPDFGQHLTFLARLRDEGVLVAAGPLLDGDGDGDGMTVVRVAESAAANLTRRAQEEDLSVVRGVLQVRVRPWSVAMTG